MKLTASRCSLLMILALSLLASGCGKSARGSEIADCIRKNVPDAKVDVTDASSEFGDDADPPVAQAIEDGELLEVVSAADAEDSGGFWIYVMSSPSAADDLADAGTVDVSGSAEGDVIVSDAGGWDEYYDGCI